MCWLVCVLLQYVWDRMLGGFKHKNNRTREGVCLCLIATLNTWVTCLPPISLLYILILYWFILVSQFSGYYTSEYWSICHYPVHTGGVCLLVYPLSWPVDNSCLPDTELKAWPSVKLFLTYVTCWGTPQVRYAHLCLFYISFVVKQVSLIGFFPKKFAEILRNTFWKYYTESWRVH